MNLTFRMLQQTSSEVTSVYRHLLFHCHYFPNLVLVFAFKFNCSLSNRYFWRCMLEHANRQVHKWKFLQLSRYVSNRILFVIFTQVGDFWILGKFDCPGFTSLRLKKVLKTAHKVFIGMFIFMQMKFTFKPKVGNI